ncbi:MAG: S41 family peptidase [Pseudomonadota bacterium]
MRQLLAAIVLMSLAPASTWAGEPDRTDDLVLLAQVWGLAKYRHPAVTRCERDWDQALLDQIDAMEELDSPAGMDRVINSLLDTAGEDPLVELAQPPAWIRDAPLEDSTRERLERLASVRPQTQCYVSQRPGTGQADFAVDTGFSGGTSFLDRRVRILAAFRFWNAIEYFFPYKTDIGRPWDRVLAEHLPAIEAAERGFDYAVAMRAFTAEIQDGHGFFASTQLAGLTGTRGPSFELQSVEGRALVNRRYGSAGDVPLGSELVSVNDESLNDRKARKAAVAYGSNPIDREANLLDAVRADTATSARFRFRDPDGVERDFILPLDPLPGDKTAEREVVREVSPDGACDMAIIDLAVLQPSQVNGVLRSVADKDAVIMDLRRYPNGTLWPMADLLYPEPRAPAVFMQPLLDDPGRFEEVIAPIGGRATIPFSPRILVLMDERAQSQSEYTVMGLQRVDRTLTFGSQTSAADGDLSSVILPGALEAFFTGLGVFYPDGRATQRIGIVPDVAVAPTIAGYEAGEDEVLAAALDCRWVDEEPPRRSPQTALYWNPSRDGEGLDIHRFAEDGMVLLQYAYDMDGNPEWLLGVAEGDGTEWRFAVDRFNATNLDTPLAVTAQASGDLALDVHRGAFQPTCAIVDQLRQPQRARFQWRVDEASGDACQEPLAASRGFPLTGLYNAPLEPGWGISVHELQNQLTVVVYAYDQTGRPRWLIGSVAATLDQRSFEIPLLHVSGYCRDCAPAQTVKTGTGSMLVEFLTLGPDAELRVDIEAAFNPDEAPWVRSDVTMERTVAPEPAKAGAPLARSVRR